MLSYRKHSNFVNVAQPTFLMRKRKRPFSWMWICAILSFTPVEDGIQKKVCCFPSVCSLLFLVKKLKIFIFYQLGLVFGNEICQKSKLKSVQVAFWNFQNSSGLWLGGEHLRVDALPNPRSRSDRPSESHNWTIVSPPLFPNILLYLIPSVESPG